MIPIEKFRNEQNMWTDTSQNTKMGDKYMNMLLKISVIREVKSKNIMLYQLETLKITKTKKSQVFVIIDSNWHFNTLLQRM